MAVGNEVISKLLIYCLLVVYALLAGSSSHHTLTANAREQYQRAMDYMMGTEHVKANEPLALDWMHKAARQGYAPAQHQLGAYYVLGDRGNDLDQAQHWLTLSAQQGYAPAQHQLGLLYYTGHGVQEDRQAAYAWLTLAMEAGLEPARKSRDIVIRSLAIDDFMQAMGLHHEYKERFSAGNRQGGR